MASTPGNGYDEALALFGAECVLQRLAAFKMEVPGVLEHKDPECLHRIRVASRRLRRALAVFRECFAEKERKGWNGRFRDVTKALGKARDLDVQIEFLTGMLGGSAFGHRDFHRGIKRVLLRLSQKRIDEQNEITQALSRLDRKEIISRMEHYLGQVCAELRLKHVPWNVPSVYDKSSERIADLLAGLLAYEPCVHIETAAAEHHAMRIACKFLRYELEIFEPLYGKTIETALQTAKKIQSLLGDIHDADVWIGFLPRFIDSEREITKSFFGSLRGFKGIVKGITFLLDDRIVKRAQTYSAFVGYWEKAKAAHVWGELAKLVGQKPARSEVY